MNLDSIEKNLNEAYNALRKNPLRNRSSAPPRLRTVPTWCEVNTGNSSALNSEDSDCFQDKIWAEKLKRKGPINDVASLKEILLLFLAQNFARLYHVVLDLGPNDREKLAHILPIDVDLSLAAMVIGEKTFWQRCLEGYFEEPLFELSRGKNFQWKTMFLEKYFANYIEKQDKIKIDYNEAIRYATAFSPYIFKLDIKGLNELSWPPEIERGSSENESPVSAHSGSTTLSEYNNRYTEYGDAVVNDYRINLTDILKELKNLEKLRISFGYQKYTRVNKLAFARITLKDAINLGNALLGCQYLTSLTLTHSKLKRKYLRAILKNLPSLTSLEKLKINNLILSPRTVNTLAHVIRHLRIESLNLQNNFFNSDSLILICKALYKYSPIKHLNLSQNFFDVNAASAVASLIINSQKNLEEVVLSGCCMKSNCVKPLAYAISYAKCIKRLDLSSNVFDCKAGWRLLSSCIVNRHIIELDVAECGLPAKTVEDIRELCWENFQYMQKKEPNLRRDPKLDLSGLYVEPADVVEEIEVRRKFKEEEIRKHKEEILKKKKEVQAINKKIMEKERATKSKQGLYGVFSTGFGNHIDSYVQEKEYQTLVDLKNEIYESINEAEEDRPKVVEKKEKKIMASKEKDFQASIMCEFMGFEQRKKHFGNLGDKDVVNSIVKLTDYCEYNPLRPCPPDEISKGPPFDAVDGALEGVSDAEEQVMKEEQRRSNAFRFIRKGSSDEVISSDSSSSGKSHTVPAPWKAKYITGIKKSSSSSSTESIMSWKGHHSNEGSEDKCGWRHRTIWNRRPMTLHGVINKNEWKLRKWKRYLQEQNDEDDEDGPQSLLDVLKKHETNIYGVYSSSSVDVTTDDELPPVHTKPPIAKADKSKLAIKKQDK